jgi:hypothetical protein
MSDGKIMRDIHRHGREMELVQRQDIESDKDSGVFSSRAITSDTSLTLPDSLEYEKWEAIGRQLKLMSRSVMWWIGDWLCFGEHKYGETYAQALDATDYETDTLRAAKWVSERILPGRRRTVLSWSHHREVAALSPEKQDYWLDKAQQERITRNDFRAQINASEDRHFRTQFTGENEWYTPSEVIEMVRRFLGAIDLDPASSEIA